MNDQISRIRGEAGTDVTLTLQRDAGEPFDLTITRAEITMQEVETSLIDGHIGYIGLNAFSAPASEQFADALQQLLDDGADQIVFDLRDNPGGALEQAIRISNRFLPRGDLIVYTRGRVPNANQDYRATEVSDYTHLPIVTLVNRNSASASEIVSGALQDHDRALVVGETTFGKALVQSVYPISENAGVAVTTGRYYTPQGRLIQRPWDGSFDDYLTYSLKDQTGDRPHKAAELKYTDAGRKVYGGGGIEPDKFLLGPVEGFNPTRFGRTLYARQSFANFADLFTAEGDTRFSAANQNKKRIARGFVVTDDMVKDFKAFLASPAHRVKIDEGSFAKDDAFIRAMLHFEIDAALFGMDEARRNLFTKDPQAQFALGQFGEAQRMTEMAKARAAGAAKRN